MRKQIKYLLSLFAFILLGFTVLGQDIPDLEQQLKEATSTKEKMYLNFQLGEAYLRRDTDKALSHAKAAHSQSTEIKNNNVAASSAYLLAQIYERDRNTRNQEVWLKSATRYAKAAGDADLIIKSVDKRSKLATKQRNYRRAYEINQEAFSYFSQSGTSMGDLERKFEMQKKALERSRVDLQKQKDKLEFDIRNLRLEMDQVGANNSQLEAKQRQLLKVNQERESQITEKEKELIDIAKEKEKAERTELNCEDERANR